MREVISINIGQAGIQSGNACWEVSDRGLIKWSLLFFSPFFLKSLAVAPDPTGRPRARTLFTGKATIFHIFGDVARFFCLVLGSFC